MEFLDDEGRLDGMVKDYVSRLEKRLGVEFQEVVVDSWDAALQAVRDGRVDVLTAVTPTDQRRAFLSFTTTHTALPGVIIARKGSGDLTLDDLHGKTVSEPQRLSRSPAFCPLPLTGKPAQRRKLETWYIATNDRYFPSLYCSEKEPRKRYIVNSGSIGATGQ